MRSPRKGKEFLKGPALILAAAMLTSLLVACGSDSDDQEAPLTRGPAVSTAFTTPDGRQIPAGVATCGYVVTREECSDSGVPEAYWFPIPDDAPSNVTIVNQAAPATDWSSMMMQMFYFHMMYDMWFSSPFYMRTYVPVAYQSSYTQHTTRFETTYRTRIDRARPQGKYKGRDGKVVTGDKVDPKKFTNTKNNGGNAGSKCKSLGPIHRVFDAFVLRVTLAVGTLAGPKPKPGGKSKSNSGGDRNSGSRAKSSC